MNIRRPGLSIISGRRNSWTHCRPRLDPAEMNERCTGHRETAIDSNHDAAKQDREGRPPAARFRRPETDLADLCFRRVDRASAGAVRCQWLGPERILWRVWIQRPDKRHAVSAIGPGCRDGRGGNGVESPGRGCADRHGRSYRRAHRLRARPLDAQCNKEREVAGLAQSNSRAAHGDYHPGDIDNPQPVRECHRHRRRTCRLPGRPVPGLLDGGQGGPVHRVRLPGPLVPVAAQLSNGHWAATAEAGQRTRIEWGAKDPASRPPIIGRDRVPSSRAASAEARSPPGPWGLRRPSATCRSEPARSLPLPASAASGRNGPRPRPRGA